jgi:hypothetical protein
MCGHIYHPETGKWLASVKDGKITAPDGLVYSLVDDKIVGIDGEVIGYLSQFNGPTVGTGRLADQLFPKG